MKGIVLLSTQKMCTAVCDCEVNQTGIHSRVRKIEVASDFQLHGLIESRRALKPDVVKYLAKNGVHHGPEAVLFLKSDSLEAGYLQTGKN